MTGPKDSCGVVGMYSSDNVVPYLHKALSVIQHRGQESAGISVFNGKDLITVKNPGLVSVALNDINLANVSGNCGIGHVRYSTVGAKDPINSQPITVDSAKGRVSVAHNGDIVNSPDIKEGYLEKGWSFLTASDAELIARIIAKHLSHTEDPVDAIRLAMAELDGAYSLAVMIDGRVFGIRDPYGFRPLCIGKVGNGYMFVSESAAFLTLRGEFIRDVEPGEIIEITKDEVISHPIDRPTKKAHCMFEWIYFARPDSIMDGREVYDVRRKVGVILAREAPADVDLVMPVPDSGRAHAIGYAIASGIPYEEGFMKNRLVDRTFILPEQSARENAVSMKMNPIKSTVNGKRILIVDDSIVRGTTLIKLVKMLKDAGAKEVHVRIGCSPVIAPCYYGVDMTSRDQFIACTHSTEEIRKIIGADSLAYISIPGLIEALGMPEEDLCLACVNGKYPTKITDKKYGN